MVVEFIGVCVGLWVVASYLLTFLIIGLCALVRWVARRPREWWQWRRFLAQYGPEFGEPRRPGGRQAQDAQGGPSW